VTGATLSRQKIVEVYSTSFSGIQNISEYTQGNIVLCFHLGACERAYLLHYLCDIVWLHDNINADEIAILRLAELQIA